MTAGRGRVLVAMSGGVDSSVAAALLQEQGYEVIGATMQLWQDVEPGTEARYGGCCSIGAVEDARSVALRLGIPYYVLHMKDVFRQRVIDYFTAEYARGRTPNPCVMCNNTIKFDAFLERALALDCDFVATGHYARRAWDAGRGRHVILKGRDPQKDQSYTLYGLTQEQLRHVLLPLGELHKPEVRRLAAERGLSVAQKPDSQEICFVLDDDHRAFLAERIPDAVRPGPILDLRGRILGTHRGLPFYTVGQRKGLGIAADRPLYVVELDAARNALVVGSADDLLSASLEAEAVNWVAWPGLAGPRRGAAKVRYRAPEVPATIEPLGAPAAGSPAGGPAPGGDPARGRVRVRFDRPQRAVTPGQFVVIYDGDAVAGGGVITRAGRDATVADLLDAAAGA